VELIGAKLDAIEKAEDRKLFKEAMERIGVGVCPSGLAEIWKKRGRSPSKLAAFP
jgi:carbamoyl-phosphate synthase large subunit